MKRRIAPPPRTQRGYMLVLVLVALVAMMISGVALVRSMDTNQLMAGNLASRSSTMHSADYGVQQAVAWLQTNAASGALNADAPTSGYYAEDLEPNWSSSSTWTACTSCQSTDGAHNTISWVVHRMCLIAGVPGSGGNFCSSQLGVASTGNSQSSDAPSFPTPPLYYYRITVQVVDPRNTATLVQAFVTL